MNPSEHIQTTYSANIDYFQKHHPKIFQKLLALENAIDDGSYTQRYELIYIHDGFDVKEIATQNTLYGNNPLHYRQTIQNNIDRSLEENIFLLTPHTMPIHPQQIVCCPKFIYFGLGLGVHIDLLATEMQSETLLLIEDDLEMFRLSLMVNDYAQLANNKKVFFSIFDEKEEFEEVANNFLEYKNYTNQAIKFFAMHHHKENKIKEFQLLFTTQPHLTFHPDDLLQENYKALNALTYPYYFLTAQNTLNTLHKPLLLVAAGPSLQKNIQLLKTKQETFFIVAVSAVLSILEAENIRVDMLIHLDSLKGASVHFEKIQNPHYFQNTLALFSSKTSPNILEMFPQNNIYLFEVGTNYKTDSLKPTAPCVGSISYQILLLLGAKELYLLGLDLAIDMQSGATHTQAHSYNQTLETSENLYESQNTEYKRSLFYTKANFQEKILTTQHFYNSIQSINLSTRYFKKEYQKVYNCSNGAYFDKTIPLYFEKIEPRLEQEEHLLLQGSIVNDADLENLSSKLIQSRKLLDTFKKIDTSDATEIQKIEHIAQTIQDDEQLQHYEIYKVLDLFVRRELSEILFFFNQQKTTMLQPFLQKMVTLIQEYIVKLEELCTHI